MSKPVLEIPIVDTYEGESDDPDSDTDIIETPGKYTEYFAKNYEKNVQPSATQYLTSISQLTPSAVQQCLHVARPVAVTEDIYDDIITYINNSQDERFGLRVLNMMRIERANEHELKSDGKLRMLLWHGTKSQHISGILQNGFKRPTSKKGMFGTGIYFADRAVKSSRYCFPRFAVQSGKTGYMFLCEVVIGEYYNAKNSKVAFTSAPTITSKSGVSRTFDSVKCTGEYVPDRDKQKKWGSVVIPYGETVKNTKYPSYTLTYNEFTVYAEEQVKIRYLITVEFTPQRVIN